MIVHTYYGLTNTKATADAFVLALAMDRGYSSTVKAVRGGHKVTASDGKAVLFLSRKGK